MERLPKLPIGIQTFETIRNEGYLYVDKTKYLVDLIDNGRIYFLSRPRRFGKSLTISTFDALFSGKKELFNGLYAEEFMNRPNYKVYPVVHLDMSDVTVEMGIDVLRSSILRLIKGNGERLGVAVEESVPGDTFSSLLERTAIHYGTQVVLLIDEYDGPVLRNVFDASKTEASREVLRDFYIRVKSADKFLRFVFMTGVSKFSRLGVFSALNSLEDISMDEPFAAMLGYTENEFLENFDGYLNVTAAAFNESKEELVAQIRDYYDGFSFDGDHRLYNPFSTLSFFKKKKFHNFWFESGTPSFLVQYIKRHDLEAEMFRGLEVGEDFTSMTEIEQASPESFLFQSGYLTVQARDGDNLTLDYPNKEVLSSITKLCLYSKQLQRL
jgi:phosphoserine phosphatase